MKTETVSSEAQAILEILKLAAKAQGRSVITLYQELAPLIEKDASKKNQREPKTKTPEKEKPKTIKETLDLLRLADPFKNLSDPAAWQREMRQDRELPYRQ